MTNLIYVADPMCSWCYGFGPELKGLLATLPEVRLDIVVGGLRAFNTEVMDAEKRNMLLGHWKHVEEASGLPFTRNGMSQPGFVYNTEPACRAVVAARTLADDMPPSAILDVFHAVQHAFYAEGKDVTDLHLLAEIGAAALNKAAGVDSFDAESFYETLTAPMTMAETREDFAQTQRWGIDGFPTLLFAHDNTLHMIANGYTKTANLITALNAVQAEE
ncbi:MAG: DsbA family protein [Pseudomonadota bacterium]